MGEHKLRPYAISAVLVALLSGSTFAQPAPAPATQPPPPDNALAGKESNQGVYVRDSAVAVDKFALAGRMEKLKEWNKAADALQEVVEKYADRVMPSQVDAKNVIYQYTSVTTAVQERLAKWPAEGLDVYRARFEPQATTMLDRAAPEDIGALHRVYALYFVTEAGKSAGIRLVDHYLESGEFPAAAWLAERLLAWHPTIDAERPKLTFRAGLAYHLAGDAQDAKAKLDELKRKFGEAKGTVHGQDVALATSLEKELATAPPVARGSAGDSWPMFGGGPDRGRVPDAAGRLGALINFVEYARERRARPVAADPSRNQAREDQRSRDDGLALGVMPAIDHGEMFFQDNQRIYAVSLETGVALPGWAATYGDRAGRYVLPNASPLPPNQHFTVTVTDNAVLAVMGQVNLAAVSQGLVMIPPGGINSATRLVCLDRASGKERWVASPSQLAESNPALKGLTLSGSPLVVGDNVFVLGRGGKPMQFEDSYVLCYSLKDGSFRWACYLASGNADPAALQNGMGMGAGGDNVSHLAYASGRLYALTNLGALAAVDAYSGTIVWLNIYPRPKPDFADFRMAARIDRSQIGNTPKPWHHNPVIVKDGKVFILPDDAQHVLVYDAGSGVEVKRIRTDDYEKAKTLLGVSGDQMVLCSDRSAFCVNWSGYDPKLKPDQNLHWRSVSLGIPTGSVARPTEQTTIRGRGFVTSESVFIPTARALYRLSLKGGKVQQSYPRDRAWDSGEGPGNVLVTQDHVIVAAADRVNVYTDLTVARARLDASVDAAPNDPEPRLRYAEMMFVSNQLDVGLQKLDEAIALLSGGGGATTKPAAGAMRPGPARDRVFNVALTFAEKLATPEDASLEDRKLAVQLFDRAALAADAPAQQVNYRMTRARTSTDPAEQVRLYQEVLTDERLRVVPFAPEDGSGTSQAAQLAEREIGDIIKKAGKSVYAAFDAKAADALAAAAQAGNDANALLAVAESYPNALTAPEAMMAAADAYEAAGDHRAANRMLTRVLRKYRGAVDPSRVVEGQVRNTLQLPGGVGMAIGRLSIAPKGARLHKPVKLPDGSVLENVTLAELAAKLHAYNTRTATAALPDFRLPDPQKLPPGQPRKATLPERPDSTIADVDMLVVPQREFPRHDRVITWTANKGLSLYAVGSTDPLGSAVAFADTPKGSAWIDGKALVWGPTRAVLLAGDSGAMLWEFTTKELPALEVAVAEESTVEPQAEENERAALERRLINNRLRAQRGVFVNVNGNMVPAGPAVQPPAAGAGEQIDICRPTSDRAIVSTNGGRVVAVELAGGKVAWQTRLVDGPLLQLLASDDFVVARFADGSGVQIAALDAYAGQAVGPRRVFPIDGMRQPINMALSPDGTLVYTFPTQLSAKNLHEPGKELNFQVPEPNDNNPRFSGANLPDQLIVANGRILALCDAGQFVRIYSLENGKEMNEGRPLATGMPANNWAVFLRPVGSRLYIVNARGVVSYNLDRMEDAWGLPPLLLDPLPAVRDAMIGQDYIVLLDHLSGQNANAGGGAARAAAPRQGYRLIAHTRGLTHREGVGMVESGRVEYFPLITSPAGISSEWQGVSGGFYYRTLDRTVHFLRGARPADAG